MPAHLVAPARQFRASGGGPALGAWFANSTHRGQTFSITSRNDVAVEQAAPVFEPAVDDSTVCQSTRIDAFAGADYPFGSASIRS